MGECEICGSTEAEYSRAGVYWTEKDKCVDYCCKQCKVNEAELSRQRIKVKEEAEQKKIEEAFTKELGFKCRKAVKVQQNYPGTKQHFVNDVWRLHGHPKIKDRLSDINTVQLILKAPTKEKLIEILDVSEFQRETKVTFLTHYPNYRPMFMVARQLYHYQFGEAETEAGIQRNDDRYMDYLGSAEWHKKRGTVIERDNYACRLCDSGENLQVHHKTYDNIYEEPLSDLITLCKNCHEHFHEIEKKGGK